MSPSYALHKALRAALLASSALSSLVGTRVQDRVGAGEILPYIHIRQFQEIDDSTDCTRGWEVTVDIDAWSNKIGKSEAHQLSTAVEDALHGQELTLDDPYALVDLRHRDTQVGDEGDGVLTRARMTFVALIERV